MLRGGWILLLSVVVGCSSADFSVRDSNDTGTVVVDSTVSPDTPEVATPEIGSDVTSPDGALDSGCAPPPVGELHVSPKGSDTLGNGSDICPFKTIKRAIGAISSSQFTTVTLHHTTTPSRYGDGCNGGAPCDVTPIDVPATLIGGVVIQGDGVASAVEISGTGVAVLNVLSPGFGLAHVTLLPTRTGANNTGTHGLVINAGGAPSERSINDVVIQGRAAINNSTGTGIMMSNAARPTLGPGLRINGGYHGVFLQGSVTVKLIGAGDGTTLISGPESSCVRVGSVGGSKPAIAIDSGGGKKNQVILESCGLPGGLVIDTFGSPLSTIDYMQVTKSAGPGVLTRSNPVVNLTNSRIELGGAAGIYADNSSNISIAGTTVSANAGIGVVVSGTATVTLNTSLIEKSGLDGVRCDAGTKLVMKDTSTLLNTGSGAHVVGTCNVDFGATTLGGGNTFNTTTNKNGLAGICRSGGAGTFAAAGSVFGCGHAGATCSSGPLPTRANAPGVTPCATGVDISEPTLAPITTPGHLCCK